MTRIEISSHNTAKVREEWTYAPKQDEPIRGFTIETVIPDINPETLEREQDAVQSAVIELTAVQSADPSQTIPASSYISDEGLSLIDIGHIDSPTPLSDPNIAVSYTLTPIFRNKEGSSNKERFALMKVISLNKKRYKKHHVSVVFPENTDPQSIDYELNFTNPPRWSSRRAITTQDVPAKTTVIPKEYTSNHALEIDITNPPKNAAALYVKLSWREATTVAVPAVAITKEITDDDH